jgi:predicted porin
MSLPSSQALHRSIPRTLALFVFLMTTPALAAEENIPESIQESIQEGIQESIKEEATRDREQEAMEDPLALQQSQKIDQPSLQTTQPDIFNFYGSLRYRYRETSLDSFSGDGGSRTGLNGRFQFHENYWVLGRVEYGFSLFDNLDLLLDASARSNNTFTESVFPRLSYGGVEFPRAFLTYGKNWSTYYQVASFTDRFQGTGAGASGAFNAATDGGPSGTGRADRVLQSRIQINHPWGPLSRFKPFALNIQYQDGERIPFAEDTDYDYSLGISAILERIDNFKLGIAFNYAAIKKEDLPALDPLGIDGDDVALLLGFQWFGSKWYAATTVSWMNNHMTTEDGIYFKGWGSEGYGHYQLADRWWLVGGWNYLEPYSKSDQAGDFILRYAVLGLRFTFKDFQRMIYANIRFDKSRTSSENNIELGNVYTIGVRWDFDWAML